MGANRPRTAPSTAASGRPGEACEPSPSRTNTPVLREGGRSVCSLCRTVERYRPQDRLDRSRRSIQLPYVTQRTSEGREGR